MLTVVKIFFRAPGANAWMVLACLVLASLSEGIGVVSLMPLLATLTSSAEGSVSPFHQEILNVMDGLGLPREFEPLLLIVVGFTLLKSVLLLFAMRYVSYAYAQVANKLRLQIVHNVLRARWSYFVTEPVGRILNAVGHEVNGAASAFRTAADFLANAIQTLAFLAIALATSWKLTLVSLLAGALVAAALHFLVGMSRRAGEKRNRRMRKLIMHLNETLTSIKPLKAMARHEASKAYMEDNLYRLKKASRKSAISVVFLKRFQDMLTVIVLGAGLFVAVRMLETGLAELLVLVVVISRVVKNLSRMQRLYQAAANVEAPHKAVYELIKETRAAEEKLHGGQPPTFDTACEFQDVSFAYGDTQVLKGVNIEVPPRGVTVIMGASGAGKTTLTDMLLGFYEPLQGKVLLDGISMEEVDLHQWRRMIGYVPQELQLMNNSIFLNVTLGDPSIDESDVEEALNAADATDFVNALPEGMHSLVGERGSRLSGGQRQRIALARAMATKPRLLILDEVSSALDPETEKEICSTLRGLSRDTAILAITHQRQFLEIADRAYRVSGGQVEEIDLSAKVAV